MYFKVVLFDRLDAIPCDIKVIGVHAFKLAWLDGKVVLMPVMRRDLGHHDAVVWDILDVVLIKVTVRPVVVLDALSHFSSEVVWSFTLVEVTCQVDFSELVGQRLGAVVDSVAFGQGSLSV